MATKTKPEPSENGLTSEEFPFGANRLPESGAENGAPDPYDPASLRLSPDLSIGLGVKKALLKVPVRKPDKTWWVRTHPSNEYTLETAVIELKEMGETYLVAPALRPELATEATMTLKALVFSMTRQGLPFIWPISLPGSDGRSNDWSESAIEAAKKARTGWVRVTANMSAGLYDVWETTAPLPDPEWPALSFRDVLRLAFREKLIDDLDHPVLRRLREGA